MFVNYQLKVRVYILLFFIIAVFFFLELKNKRKVIKETNILSTSIKR